MLCVNICLALGGAEEINASEQKSDTLTPNSEDLEGYANMKRILVLHVNRVYCKYYHRYR